MAPKGWPLPASSQILNRAQDAARQVQRLLSLDVLPAPALAGDAHGTLQGVRAALDSLLVAGTLDPRDLLEGKACVWGPSTWYAQAGGRELQIWGACARWGACAMWGLPYVTSASSSMPAGAGAAAPVLLAQALKAVLQQVAEGEAQARSALSSVLASLAGTVQLLDAPAGALNAQVGDGGAAALPALLAQAVDTSGRVSRAVQAAAQQVSELSSQRQALQQQVAAAQQEVSRLKGTAQAEWAVLRSEAERALQVTRCGWVRGGQCHAAFFRMEYMEHGSFISVLIRAL